ncbi:hypothetical protein VTJ49DRAFT_3087 [Mycothermus thermophilus]|uniref:Cell wall mannoprotein PIR1-like C-terminal domain-containing protein n=1 Tax=Humicola insolens TaxID=85995 RepID=A0ABR3V938_HUMIN
MKFALFFAVLGMAVVAMAQGVIDKIAPPGDHPVGCEGSRPYKFMIATVPTHMVKRARSLQRRAICAGTGNLVLNLTDEVLTDALDRTGYISMSYQFQFDNPPQSGALFTAGFTACLNDTLALGPTTVFWQCASGTFWNLYDRWSAPQCEPVHIVILPCDDLDEATTSIESGLVETATSTETATTTVNVCQIDDGQVQAHTTPCPAIPTDSLPPASQISDGQVQITTMPDNPAASLRPASQFSDGQVQITTNSGGDAVASPPPVSEQSDGQVIVTATGSGVVPTEAPASEAAGLAKGLFWVLADVATTVGVAWVVMF